MNSDPAELSRRVPSARRHDDGVVDATNAGLRLSTATILSRWNMVEGAPHTANRSQGSIVVSRGGPRPRI